MPLYHYVGPPEIAARAAGQRSGTPMRSGANVVEWLRDTSQQPNRGTVTVTYTIAEDGTLLIADRHSEHVACAGGQPVRSAGEMTFRVIGGQVAVECVSNQSTGYCPEPESWPAVMHALGRAGLNPPEGFEPACVFRRCEACGWKNVVKGGAFECGACSAELPAGYNCQG